jgi:hypothetical protein
MINQQQLINLIPLACSWVIQVKKRDEIDQLILKY